MTALKVQDLESPLLARAVVIVLAISMLCSGCAKRIEADKEDFHYNPVLYKDPITGCEYLSSAQSNTLTPRISGDGRTHRGCQS